MFALAMAVVMIPGATAFAASKVKIDKSVFPDKGLRERLKELYDTDKDGYLSSKEIKTIKALGIYVGHKVSDLTGIEQLTSLTNLYVESDNLKSYDLSKNKNLTTLAIRANISSVDVTKLTKLENLWIESTKLQSVDISKNTQLKDLMLTAKDGYCKVKNLDLSSNKELKSILIYSDRLESLDVTKNLKLEELNLSSFVENGYLLKSIKFGNNKVLKKAFLGINGIESIDISKCADLEEFSIYSPKLSDIDVSKNQKLKKLDLLMCSGLKEIDISANTGLKSFSFSESVPRIIVAAGQKFDSGSIVKSGSNIKYSSSDSSVFTYKSKTIDKDTYTTVFEAKKAGTGKMITKLQTDVTYTEVRVLYKDVTRKGDFWYEPTYALSDSGIVKGYAGQTEFRPQNECTRAQMVTFLWRLNGSPAPKAKTTSFADVKKGAYYFKAVIWAVEQGITTGISKDKFAPEGVCTRAQTVAFLWRMAGKPEPKAKTCKFSDVKNGDYFYKATIWASEKKIVAGYSDGTFQPKGKCLRRQMVTFLYKYSKNVTAK